MMTEIAGLDGDRAVGWFFILLALCFMLKFFFGRD